MPVYEYACEACGHTFEEWQKINDPPVKICPKCKARKVQRLISRTSFQLKGGGWYGDLYSSVKPGDSGKSDGSSSSDGAKPEAGAKPEGSSPSESKAGGDAKAKTPRKKGKIKAA